MKQSVKIGIYNKNTNLFIGTIKRRLINVRQFGSVGSFEVSIGGERYIGRTYNRIGHTLELPSTVIKYLKNKREIEYETISFNK